MALFASRRATVVPDRFDRCTIQVCRSIWLESLEIGQSEALILISISVRLHGMKSTAKSSSGPMWCLSAYSVDVLGAALSCGMLVDLDQSVRSLSTVHQPDKPS